MNFDWNFQRWKTLPVGAVIISFSEFTLFPNPKIVLDDFTQLFGFYGISTLRLFGISFITKPTGSFRIPAKPRTGRVVSNCILIRDDRLFRILNFFRFRHGFIFLQIKIFWQLYSHLRCVVQMGGCLIVLHSIICTG